MIDLPVKSNYLLFQLPSWTKTILVTMYHPLKLLRKDILGMAITCALHYTRWFLLLTLTTLLLFPVITGKLMKLNLTFHFCDKLKFKTEIYLKDKFTLMSTCYTLIQGVKCNMLSIHQLTPRSPPPCACGQGTFFLTRCHNLKTAQPSGAPLTRPHMAASFIHSQSSLN